MKLSSLKLLKMKPVDILTTKEEVKQVRRDLEKATEKKFKAFDKAKKEMRNKISERR